MDNKALTLEQITREDIKSGRTFEQIDDADIRPLNKNPRLSIKSLEDSPDIFMPR